MFENDEGCPARRPFVVVGSRMLDDGQVAVAGADQVFLDHAARASGAGFCLGVWLRAWPMRLVQRQLSGP